jgi:hypothetical protein
MNNVFIAQSDSLNEPGFISTCDTLIVSGLLAWFDALARLGLLGLSGSLYLSFLAVIIISNDDRIMYLLKNVWRTRECFGFQTM